MLLEVDEWLLKRTVPSLHANFNQEIDLKHYNKVRELACVIYEFVRLMISYTCLSYLKKLYQIITLVQIKLDIAP